MEVFPLASELIKLSWMGLATERDTACVCKTGIQLISPSGTTLWWYNSGGRQSSSRHWYTRGKLLSPRWGDSPDRSSSTTCSVDVGRESYTSAWRSGEHLAKPKQSQDDASLNIPMGTRVAGGLDLLAFKGIKYVWNICHISHIHTCMMWMLWDCQVIYNAVWFLLPSRHKIIHVHILHIHKLFSAVIK